MTENTDHPLSEIDAAEAFLAGSGKPRMDFTLPGNWESVFPSLRVAFDLGRAYQADLPGDAA